MPKTMDRILEDRETKSVDYYLELPYTWEIVREDGGYFARVREIPGCFYWADNLEDLEHGLQVAMQLWIDKALERGDKVPEPSLDPDKDFSGKVLMRMPKILHRRLAYEAESEGVSLNQYAVSLLANQVGGF